MRRFPFRAPTSARARVLKASVFLLLAARIAQAEEPVGKTSFGASLRELGKSLAKNVLAGAEPLPPSSGQIEVTETALAVVPTNVAMTEILISLDQRRVAYVEKRATGAVLVVNGKAGPLYDEIASVRFSPDSRRLAYAGRRGEEQYVVVDGVEGAPYSPWRDMYPIFSPDSKRIAYMARSEKASFVIVDDVRSNPFRSLDMQSHPVVVFSPDSRRIAYLAALEDSRQAVAVDGVMGQPYRSVSQPTFSPDSKHWACWISEGGGRVLVDGAAGPAFAWVSLWGWVGGGVGSDAQRVVYVGHAKDLSQTMMVGGDAGRTYEEIVIGSVACRSNAADVVYVARRGKQYCVVTHGVEGPLYDGIQWYPRISPDGKRVAHVARKPTGCVAVCDGQEGGMYSSVSYPVFSPDSRHVAYAASRGLKWTVVCDGREGLWHDIGEEERTEIFFSPDSQRMAYRASRGRTVEFVVVDGKASVLYRLVEPGQPTFSSDSIHVAYWACPAGGGWRIFVDGAYTERFERPLWGSKLVFDGPTELRALAARDREILAVRIRPGDRDP